MIFLRVLPKISLWPHYSGAPGARGPRFIEPPEPPVPTPLHQCPEQELNQPLCLVNTFLCGRRYLVVKRVELWAVRKPQISAIKPGVSLTQQLDSFTSAMYRPTEF